VKLEDIPTLADQCLAAGYGRWNTRDTETAGWRQLLTNMVEGAGV
jgi:hypothetical protein